MPVGDDHERRPSSRAAARGGDDERVGRRLGDRPVRPRRTGCTSPRPASTPRRWRRARAPAASCCASGPYAAPRGTTSCSTRSPRSRDLDWRCTVVGALDLDPALRRPSCATGRAVGIADRVSFTGPAHRDATSTRRTPATDLLVSRVAAGSPTAWSVTEALARGIPVVATDVGGLPEAVGPAPDGARPGLLVPPDDVDCAGRPRCGAGSTDAGAARAAALAAGRRATRRVGRTTWPVTRTRRRRSR